MVKACKNLGNKIIWISCVCHNLNLVVENSLKLTSKVIAILIAILILFKNKRNNWKSFWLFCWKWWWNYWRCGRRKRRKWNDRWRNPGRWWLRIINSNFWIRNRTIWKRWISWWRWRLRVRHSDNKQRYYCFEQFKLFIILFPSNSFNIITKYLELIVRKMRTLYKLRKSCNPLSIVVFELLEQLGHNFDFI